MLSCSATGDRSGSRRAEYGVLLDRERAWADAMRSHDYAALERILAPEFRLTFAELPPGFPGKPEVTREEWLENLRSMNFGPVETSEHRTVMLSPTVAGVTIRMTLHDWRWGDDPIPPDYDLVDIWVLREGRWQVVNRISQLRVSEEAPRP